MKTIRRIIIENEEKVLEGENGKYFDIDGKKIVPPPLFPRYQLR